MPALRDSQPLNRGTLLGGQKMSRFAPSIKDSLVFLSLPWPSSSKIAGITWGKRSSAHGAAPPSSGLSSSQHAWPKSVFTMFGSFWHASNERTREEKQGRGCLDFFSIRKDRGCRCFIGNELQTLGVGDRQEDELPDEEESDGNSRFRSGAW